MMFLFYKLLLQARGVLVMLPSIRVFTSFSFFEKDWKLKQPSYAVSMAQPAWSRRLGVLAHGACGVQMYCLQPCMLTVGRLRRL